MLIKVFACNRDKDCLQMEMSMTVLYSNLNDVPLKTFPHQPSTNPYISLQNKTSCDCETLLPPKQPFFQKV